jgi:hypothetical protein
MSVEEEKKKDDEKAEEMCITFPNICQSLHIGCNKYDEMIKESPLESVKKSHEDVNTYYKFFKDDLKYDRALTFADNLK